MNTISNICIIPARGGSKRIPRKNIKNFLGKPIIAYSIEAAIRSELFSEVMVSTDDLEIAEIAKIYGAKVPFIRSQETANDFATLSNVVDEVLENYKKEEKVFINACCLLPTAPFVNKELLNNTYSFFVKSSFDSVRPIVKYSYPIQRSFRLDDNGGVKLFFPEHMKTRSQDLEVIYHDAGLFYWMNTIKKLHSNNKGGFIISEIVAHDIDNQEDWEIAEMKYKIFSKKKPI